MGEPRKSLQGGGGGVDGAASVVAGHQPTSPFSEQIKEALPSHPSRDRLAPGRARNSRKMKFPRTTVKEDLVTVRPKKGSQEPSQ